MTEYIERAAAMDAILGLTIADPAVAQYADAVCYHLQNLPAADVAEVVRCGECRHAEDSLVLWCHEHEKAVSMLDFCSHGARMDKEAEYEAD